MPTLSDGTIDRILIDPVRKQASLMANWIKKQGDGRGLIVEEQDKKDYPYLISWDSYGYTHSDIVNMFNLQRRCICECLIFRIDGSLFTENSYQGRVAVQNYTGHARIDNFLADVCKLVNPFNKLPMVTRD